MGDTGSGPADHWLAPMLAPGTVAVVGASNREGTVGERVMASLMAGELGGRLWPINPRYDKVGGLDCFGSLAELPSAPDLAVLSVASERMEGMFDEAIAAGARSLVVFDPCAIEGDSNPKLLDRLKGRAREAGIPVCGGNGVGFYNFDSQTFAAFSPPLNTSPGHIAAFCHSGSVWGMLGKFDARFRFNLLTSQGQEINGSVADYMDYALELRSTRVLALFLEAVRDPQRFMEVLAKAQAKDIPVVITKVGRSARSAYLATTHSGAIAGSDSAFDAVCHRYGVLRTDDLDGLAATAQILALAQRTGPGDFGVILDSGGLREQLIDMAEDMSIPLADLTPGTTARLRARLPHMLEAVNPLDAAGPLREDYNDIIIDCVAHVTSDPNVAIVGHEIYMTDKVAEDSPQADAATTMAERFGKPFFVFNSFSTVPNTAVSKNLMDKGVPLINGLRPMLTGVRHAMAYRDSRRRATSAPEAAEPVLVATWHSRLTHDQPLGEAEALELMQAFGLPIPVSVVCDDLVAAQEAARRIGFPVVLKTAEPSIQHKSDVGGVKLGLADADDLAAAYDDVAGRLGPKVTIAAMATKGVELAFGMVRDNQFGPIVLVGAGGVLVESLDDRCFALPPFGVEEAKHLIGRLKVSRLLDGVRGGPPADRESLAAALSRFSVLAAAVGDIVAEIDVNPVIAGHGGAVAVDALVVRG